MVSSKIKNNTLLMLRTQKKWTQEEVAKQLKITTVTYQKIERGECQSKPIVWKRIKDLYKIPSSKMWDIMEESM